jgi:hypothetical protein
MVGRVFELQVDQGVLPIRFGMTAVEVKAVMGEEPTWVDTRSLGETKLAEHYDDFVGVHYNAAGEVYSVVVAPGSVVLRFGGVELLGPSAVPNPLLTFYQFDSRPLEDVGFVFFNKLGVAVSGFHDGKVDERAITVRRPGMWDVSRSRLLGRDRLQYGPPPETE